MVTSLDPPGQNLVRCWLLLIVGALLAWIGSPAQAHATFVARCSNVQQLSMWSPDTSGPRLGCPVAEHPHDRMTPTVATGRSRPERSFAGQLPPGVWGGWAIADPSPRLVMPQRALLAGGHPLGVSFRQPRTPWRSQHEGESWR
jgi:hypothetical protein